MPRSYEIRPLVEADWPILRDLRLRALEESPDSFGPTLPETMALDESTWRAWSAGRPGRLQAFGAFDGEQAVGLVSGSCRTEATGGFGAVWVDPAARGSGLARRLVETVCEWLESLGCTRIDLHVTDGNAVAEGLYQSMGFTRTGDRHPLREGSPLFEVTMARTSSPSPAASGEGVGG